MRCEEKILRAGNPLDLGNWSAVDDALGTCQLGSASSHIFPQFLTFLFNRAYL